MLPQKKKQQQGRCLTPASGVGLRVLVATSQMVGGQNVETVVAHDVIGRMMIQCARQPGLAQIWETLLGFEHCEFYAKAWPQLEGATFRDALLAFHEAVPIGLKVQGYTVLNPNDDYVLQPGDEVLVIAEDDDSYAPQAPAVVHEAVLPAVALAPKIPEKILFCGWRRDIDDMIVVCGGLPRLLPGTPFPDTSSQASALSCLVLRMVCGPQAGLKGPRSPCNSVHFPRRCSRRSWPRVRSCGSSRTSLWRSGSRSSWRGA